MSSSSEKLKSEFKDTLKALMTSFSDDVRIYNAFDNGIVDRVLNNYLPNIIPEQAKEAIDSMKNGHIDFLLNHPSWVKCVNLHAPEDFIEPLLLKDVGFSRTTLVCTIEQVAGGKARTRDVEIPANFNSMLWRKDLNKWMNGRSDSFKLIKIEPILNADLRKRKENCQDFSL